jgi:SAM-dependent methyltransferase
MSVGSRPDPAAFVGADGVARRAALSAGASEEPIHRAVRGVLDALDIRGTVFVDVGAGAGALVPYLAGRCREVWAVDVVRYDALPPAVRFVRGDLDHPPVDLPDGCADAVLAVEVVEHLENPRQFLRELVRLARPGGWVLVTTPNQVSLLSILSLALRQRFAQFGDRSYPAHLTALLPIDLVRIATEVGLERPALSWTRTGRVPGTALHWPAFLGTVSPRLFSDNVVLVGRRPA